VGAAVAGVLVVGAAVAGVLVVGESVAGIGEDDGLHCEYHLLWRTHSRPEAQHVGPL